jgi:hypothetical protein
MADLTNTNIAKDFAKANEPLIKEMKNVLIAVSVGAAGYFLTELGKGMISAVVRNGIEVPTLPTK